MLKQKVMHNFPHDIGLVPAGLVDLDPDAALEGSIQVIGYKQLQLPQIRALIILSMVLNVHRDYY